MTGPQPESIHPEIAHLVEAARGVWTRRLIDHSRSNSLLFYRQLKVGTLDLSANAGAVARLLAGEAVSIAGLAAAVGSDGSSDLTTLAAGNEAVEQKIRQALIAIQRKALSNMEEKGIETLFLATGMATWPAADGGRPYQAPVLLFPAKIETRGRGAGEVRLIVAGEPQLNPVLRYVLDDTFSVKLSEASLRSECRGDEEADQWRPDTTCASAYVMRAASGIQGFQVTGSVVLANFQFAKMAMVEDLRRHADQMANSPIVAAIAGHSPSRQLLSRAVGEVSPASLDERPARDDFLVLDADSTQQRAIVLIGKTQSGVIQGPPGTGKSQTIANLIAQSVADGRRVLFVAEKRAALEAVIKRLGHPDVGLAHLVLDLHGASVSRKEVMARLANTLDQIRNALPVNAAEAIHRDFEARRRQLNEHAHQVNAARQPSGLSVIQMVGGLLKLPAAARSALRLRGDALATLKAERAEEARRMLLDGAANPTLVLGTDSSPWNNADIADGRGAQAALDLAVQADRALMPALLSSVGATVQALGLPNPQTLAEIRALISVLRDLRRLREHYSAEIFTSQSGELADAIGPAARGRVATAWAYLTNRGFRAARNALLAIRTSPAPARTLLEEARRASGVVPRWRGLGAPSIAAVDAIDTTALAAALLALDQATTTLGAITERGSFDSMPIDAAVSRLHSLAADRLTPYQLPGAYATRRKLIETGLAGLVDDLRDNPLSPELWVARFEHVWLYSSLEAVLASDPALASFNGRTHEQIVADFIRLDRERVRMAAQRVKRVHGQRAIEAMNSHFDQANLIKTEAAKRSRHLALRDLLAGAPDVLTRVAPCWVASPLSVSQLLDGGKQHFDVVVFDEASQILQEEAIPSLYRAPQVVVAGDRHQLPPTTFFATAVEGEDDLQQDADASTLATATAAVGGFESLLGTLEAFLPNWMLEWHYRSEDERLIAFSNHHIYDDRLITFPSARGHQAMRHVLVPHDASLGTQEESASREVEQVVREILRHADERPMESLGVITMGIKHANRVQASLDRALEMRPDLADFFSLEREERFFVKNLETVQGDERDAIILTVGYGKAANGDLPHRFGPLTQDAGHRRLNVAITRAKRRMTVVSSFSHQEVDLSRSGSRGVKMLKAFLEYAANGGTSLPESERAGEVPLNAFEADIRDALEGRGILVRPQFGASRYRIDLATMHPRRAGRPVLAIECDGASYHSSSTARDRDRLRQAHLMRLGWRFHRIWSTDWFYSREQELERAVAAYEEAVRYADVADGVGAAAAPAQRQVVSGSGPLPAVPVRPVVRQGPRPLVTARENIDQYSDRELRQLIEWVASDGLLRTDDEVVRDVFALLPFQRMGQRIRGRLEGLVQRMRRRMET